jgi:hypothetical protein
MYGRMDRMATFQPRGELWIRTTRTQVDNEISRNRCGARLLRGWMNEVQHEVDAGSNAGARVAVTARDVETVFEKESLSAMA